MGTKNDQRIFMCMNFTLYALTSNTLFPWVIVHSMLYFNSLYIVHSELKKNTCAIRNCCIRARGAIKLHPFGTSAERNEICVMKGCDFIAPQALIQQLYF